MDNITPGQKLGFAIVGVISAMLSTTLCVACDSFNEGYAPMPWIYWAFLFAGALPAAFALWILRKPTAWFFFGVWLGVLTLLPWIPWFGGKRFFNAVHELHTGMSLTEVRTLMNGFTEEEGPFNGQAEQTGFQQFNYAWDRDGVSDLDNATVTFQDGRVVKVYVSTE